MLFGHRALSGIDDRMINRSLRCSHTRKRRWLPATRRPSWAARRPRRRQIQTSRMSSARTTSSTSKRTRRRPTSYSTCLMATPLPRPTEAASLACSAAAGSLEMLKLRASEVKYQPFSSSLRVRALENICSFPIPEPKLMCRGRVSCVHLITGFHEARRVRNGPKGALPAKLAICGSTSCNCGDGDPSPLQQV